MAVLLSVPARAEGVFEPAQRLYLEGNLRGALLVSIEGLAASPGDAPLGRLQRLVLDDMQEAERARLAGESAELRRRSLARTVEVRNGLEECRRGDLALYAGDRDWARSLYERAREVLPRHPCWREGLADMEDEAAAPPESPRPRRRAAPRRAVVRRSPPPSPAESAPEPAPVKMPAREPAAAHRAYLEGLSSYLGGFNAKATESLQEAVRLDPSHARARNLLERVGREGEP